MPRDVAAAMREVYRLRQEIKRERLLNQTLGRQLGEIQMAQEEAGIAGDAVYDRPALAMARRAKKDLTNAVHDLADLARDQGFGAAALKASTDLLDDLSLLSIAPPRGPAQAQRRSLVRRWLTHPGLLAQLVEDKPGRIYALKVFDELVSSAYSEPAFRRVFERSAEIHEAPERRHG